MVSVLIHRGPSAYSGHYIAHIRDKEQNAWYKFNDETIDKMGAKSLQLGTEDDIGKYLIVISNYRNIASNSAEMNCSLNVDLNF